jgi:hypothetical protein
MPTKMPTLLIEPIMLSDLPAHMRLVGTTYEDPTALNHQHFWWKHGAGPSGPSTTIGLYDGDRLVGRAMVQRRKFRIDATKTVSGGLVFDLMLAPEHRTAANFLLLVQAQSKLRDVDVIVHTSNAASDPLYQKLLRFPIACHLAAYGLPVRAERIFRKIFGLTIPGLDILTLPWRLGLRAAAAVCQRLSGLDIKLGMPPASELPRITACFAALAGPQFERDGPFLDWRFHNGPLFNGAVAALSHSRRICGYVAWRNVTFEGLRSLVLLDLVLDSPLTGFQRIALRLDLLSRACRGGDDLVVAMMNPESKPAAEILGFPFVPLPEHRLPHRTPIFVRPLSDGLDSLRDLHSICISLADIDYF